ncbi:hypothetical protein BDK51DRAFT_25767 [Blyttiomyces helicus]|uniref:Uncharacterized protein n=1 Tax=Blyttiomyces helicus TaxID=388810 RepID=A0A4P9WHP5_9FUNG|nr:hypothetical protein BDK51DRAFT_25767 [Blyttiomyces helicus]|eukprot:RKO91912.1 hypothetical protein BDK51DRAFT_25767 [Blyttiomyces helicus]
MLASLWASSSLFRGGAASLLRPATPLFRLPLFQAPSPAALPLAQLTQSRGSKYKKIPKDMLPTVMLPKQRTKTTMLSNALRVGGWARDRGGCARGRGWGGEGG